LNVATSGKVEVPTVGLSCADTINFTNPTANAAIQTIVSGVGTLLLGGNSAGINVEAAANVTFVADPTSALWIKSGGQNQTLTLLPFGGEVGWVGNGTIKNDLQVVNQGGTFIVGKPQPDMGTVVLQLSGASGSYTQGYLVPSAVPTLKIATGSVLDA